MVTLNFLPNLEEDHCNLLAKSDDAFLNFHYQGTCNIHLATRQQKW